MKRTVSLLATAKLRIADLPYMMHCESYSGETESLTDACLRKVEEIYNDFSNVLDFLVMLVGGARPNEGHVEIIYQGRHGTVCGMPNWWNYFKNADVVCRMLGYTGASDSYCCSMRLDVREKVFCWHANTRGNHSLYKDIRGCAAGMGYVFTSSGIY